MIISESGRLHTLQMVSVAFPLTLSVIYLLRESRLWSDQSLLRFILTFSPLLVLYCVFSWAPDTYHKLLFWDSLPVTMAQTRAIPPLTWVTHSMFLLVIAYLPDLKIKPFLTALMATLIPFLYCVQDALITTGQKDQTTPAIHVIVSFTTITIILLHCILRMYWQKVYLDLLTGVPNRQALDERLHTLSGNFALAMVDIDHFKKFNDTYGHAEGDNVLRMVAQHLEEHLGDRVYRYGGEEFCVVFDDKHYEKAEEMMDQTRASMAKRKFALRGHRRQRVNGLMLPFQKNENRGKKVNITISVGVAAAGKTYKIPEEVIKRADHWLYEAKSNGRNRVASEK
jgi:diguanylate cyclase (GGDEF)-like protein